MMGQQDVFDFLRENEGKFLLVEQIAKGVGLGKRSVYSCLQKLEDDGCVESGMIQVGVSGTTLCKAFKYVFRDGVCEGIHGEVVRLGRSGSLRDSNTDQRFYTVIVKELRKISDLLKGLLDKK